MPPQAGNGRTLKFVLSDESVGRDGHVIYNNAWQLTNYRNNPVFLWAHDSSLPPVGRMVEIGNAGDKLMGVVQFPNEGEHEFSDTIYNLYRSGFLNATSAGWMPLEWEFSKEKNRIGGINFRSIDALEFSAVPVPALPSALISARSVGINTKPICDWAERALDSGDQIVVPRAELETLRTAARSDGSDAAVAARRAHAAALRSDFQAEEEKVAQRRARAAQIRTELDAGSDASIELRRTLARRVRAECYRLIAGVRS